MQQTLSLFVVGFGIAQLVSGPFSDRHGRRPTILGGFAIYLAGSLACALAPGIELLIAARVIQAVGCCTVVVVARAVVRDVYPLNEAAAVMSRVGTMVGLVPLAGPILGGYLQVWFGWRAAFVVHCLAAMALAVLTLRLLAETNAEPDRHALRPRRLAASYAGILRSAPFWAYALPAAASYGAIFAFIAGSPHTLIEVLGVPTQHYGYCFASGVLGYLAGTFVCRRLLVWMGAPRALLCGAGIAICGGGGLLLAAALWPHWLPLLLSQALVMGAHGVVQPCAQAGAIAHFQATAGAAAGLLGALMMALAWLVSTWLGVTLDDTVYPLAVAAAAMTGAVLVSALAMRRWRDDATSRSAP